MRLVLTKGFDGEEVQLIGESAELSVLNNIKHGFLNKGDTIRKYHIVPFETHTLKNDGDMIIDFGDYEYFMRVEKQHRVRL